jgi:hypothetical protein
MKKNFLCLMGGVLLSLPLLFASCGNGDNALEEIINGGGSGGGEVTSITVDLSKIDEKYLDTEKTKLQLTVGDEVTLSFTILPAEMASTEVELTSADATILSIDGLKVKALKEGETKVTAKAGDKTAECTVIVKDGYLKWDADQKELVATPMPDNYTTVEEANGSVTWAAGTYVVEGDVTINGIITLNGDVDLIIKDGAKLTAMLINGSASDKKNFRIYGQANQSGQLVVNCPDDDAIVYMATLEVHSCQVKATSSQDGRGGFYSINTFNVYGGSVDAECTGTRGYGIYLASSGSMNIYGGDVKAVGKGTNYQGIYGSASTVTVYGGKLWAECADDIALKSVTLAKGEGFSGKIEYSSDKSTWSETVDASAKYVRAGY